MRYVGFSSQGETRNYSEIAQQAMHGVHFTEVSEDEYDYMLNVLPPIYLSLGPPGGFLVMEALCDSELGPVHAHYAKFGGKYYGKWAVKGRRETYINPNYAAQAYPMDEEHARIARECNEYGS
jgi:hypothetical protein